MACGTAVLSSNAGSLAEVLGDGAELLPPAGPERWAEALIRLLRDTAARADLVRRGHARVARYSWARTAEQTRAAYRDALGN